MVDHDAGFPDAAPRLFLKPDGTQYGSDGVPGRHQLTPRKMLSELINLGLLFKHDTTPMFAGMAQGIILNALGPAFWARECCSFSNPGDFLLKRAQIRQLHLASLIWRTLEVEGQEGVLQRIRDHDLESAYMELYWLDYFSRVFTKVRFNPATQGKGLDFDLYLEDGAGFAKLNAEVKARKEDLVDANMVRNFLKKAKSQLPPGENNIIAFKIAQPGSGLSQQELDDCIRQFVTSTSRIDAVLYCWDQSESDLLIAIAHATVTAEGRRDDLFFAPIQLNEPPSFVQAAISASRCSVSARWRT